MVFTANIHLPADIKQKYKLKPYTTKSDILDYCVYGYLRESDDAHGPAMSVRYIGEGTPSRPIQDHRVGVPPNNRYIVIFKDGISKDEGLNLEKILVDKFGRICNGTGILENVRAGGGGWGANGLSWTLDLKPCLYCKLKFGRLDLHEASCKHNPNKAGSHNAGRLHIKNNCQHCSTLIPINRLAVHEQTCSQNPNKVNGPMRGKHQRKQNCKFCDGLFSVCNIDRHESTCKQNPNKTNLATKGRPSEKLGKKYCKICSCYVTNCHHLAT